MSITPKSILTIVSAALLLVNGLLIYQNFTLKAQLAELAPREIQEGDRLPAINTKDLNNTVSSIKFNENNLKTVFFYFHPTCG